MKDNIIFKKIIVIIIGAIIMAYGVTLAPAAGFGQTTLAVLWYGMVYTFHITVGMASLITAIIMFVFILFYDRRQIHIGTVIYQVAYSGCIEIFSRIQKNTPYVFINFIIMMVGIFLLGVGTALYSSSDYGRGTYDALMFAFARKNNWQIRIVRIVIDVTVVIIGILLGGKFGICTIVTAFAMGPIIQFMTKIYDRYIWHR